MDIYSLIDAIGTSVSDAQHRMEDYSLRHFLGYFDSGDDKNDEMNESLEEENGENGREAETRGLTPITEKIFLPRSDDISQTAAVDIPLVSLVNHRQVHLNKVVVKVKTRLTSDGGDTVMADINAPIFNTANSDDDSAAQNDGNTSELELVFNVSDSAEGLSKVVQNLSNTF